MQDQEIVALYWARSEDAIVETREKYGPYCTSIAYRLLNSIEDTEECLSDTWLRTWDSIPPHRPECLKPYVGRITRNLALDRLRRGAAQKRGEVPLVLEEAAALETAESAVEGRLLAAAITDFLRTLPVQKRQAFVLRYWYLESQGDIARRLGWSQARVKTELYRTRKKLADYLKKEGFLP